LALANYSWLNRQLGKGMLRIDKVEEMPHEQKLNETT
jgi:hypothetical protein